jgi:hypothetical protein
MAKDGTDVMETGDGIARREFRSQHAAGNEAALVFRGSPCVAELLLT